MPERMHVVDAVRRAQETQFTGPSRWSPEYEPPPATYRPGRDEIGGLERTAALADLRAGVDIDVVAQRYKITVDAATKMLARSVSALARAARRKSRTEKDSA